MTACLRSIALFLTTSVAGSLLLASGPSALAQTQAQEASAERAVIEIIQIRHRSPARVRDAVTAALDPRGRVGVIDDKLVIATTAANLQQLRDIIADADSLPKRLIVGVDFAFQADATDGSTQQQSQAIEGESLVFVSRSAEPAQEPETETETVPAESPDQLADNVPRVTIAAEIVAPEIALVNVNLSNPDGLSDNHIVRVPLGAWQLITPAVAVRIDVVP